MSIYTKANLKIKINDNIADNTTKNITPAKVRAIFTDLVDSTSFINGLTVVNDIVSYNDAKTFTNPNEMVSKSYVDNKVDLTKSFTVLTHQSLLTLMLNSELVQGQKYLISDYRTKYIQPVTNVFKQASVTESLILTAISTYSFDNKVVSVEYPKDYIEYDITNILCEDNILERPGKITYRIDEYNNTTFYDSRTVVFDRSSVDKLTFGANCNNNYIAKSESIGLTYNNIIFGDHCFYNTILDGYNTTFGVYCYANYINGCFNNTIGDTFFDNNIGLNFQHNIIGNGCNTNNIKSNFSYNTIGNDFYNNNINSFVTHNTIGGNFFANTIGTSFQYNDIDLNFYNNITGNYFDHNNIGINFRFNEIGHYFAYNTIKDVFQQNTIKSKINGLNFNTANYVYEEYDCEIFINSDLEYKLRYMDPSDVLIVVWPTE